MGTTTMGGSSDRLALRPIHPFPARMAPGLVLERLGEIGENSRVLDPMAGSGVVLRQAIELGHEAVGFDLDPLAVLMTRVWTTPISEKNLNSWAACVVGEARAMNASTVELDWMDAEEETRSFVDYWFGASQRADLRQIAFVLSRLGQGRLHGRLGVTGSHPVGIESDHRHQGAACVTGPRHLTQPATQGPGGLRLSGVPRV